MLRGIDHPDLRIGTGTIAVHHTGRHYKTCRAVDSGRSTFQIQLQATTQAKQHLSEVMGMTCVLSAVDPDATTGHLLCIVHSADHIATTPAWRTARTRKWSVFNALRYCNPVHTLLFCRYHLIYQIRQQASHPLTRFPRCHASDPTDDSDSRLVTYPRQFAPQSTCHERRTRIWKWKLVRCYSSVKSIWP